MASVNGRWTLTASRLRLIAVALLVLHIVLGVVYSVVTPAWEAVDEWGHFMYVRYVATHRALPPAGELLMTELGGVQGTQPPLYYILAALPAALAPLPADYEPVRHVYGAIGRGEYGVNMVVHDPAAEAFPWQGTFLALHLARLASVLLSAAGVWFVFLLLRWLLADQPWLTLAGTALAAFAPQYLFIGSAVNNDILVAVLGCATLYFACRLALEPARSGDLVGLGLSLGLAQVTKNTSLGLLPIAAAALALAGRRAARSRSARHALQWGAAVLAVLLALDGWWIARNVANYGAPISRDVDTLALFFQGLTRPAEAAAGIPWAQIPNALWYGFQTFWGTFGWANVGMAPWVYFVLAGLCGASLVGCLILLARRQTPRRLKGAILFLGFSALTLVALPFGRELLRGQAVLSGRFLFLTLPAVSFFWAVGLLGPLPAAGRRIGSVLITAGLLAFAVLVPVLVIAPAYARPAPPSEALPAGAQPIVARFDNRIELYGYEIWPARVPMGHAVGVTLYWKALAPIHENFSIGVYALGAGAQPYGQLVRYPAHGNFPTSIWKPGDRLADTFWVPLQSDRPTPCLGRIAVAVFLDLPEPLYLPAKDGDGQELGDSVIFGRFKIAPAAAVAAPLEPALGRLGDELALIDVRWVEPPRAGSFAAVQVRLQALAQPRADYTLFVHLLDGNGERITGSDAPPQPDYPTGLWERGEAFDATLRIFIPYTLPAGPYRLAVGLYRPDTGERLPAYDAAGSALPDGRWLSPPAEIAASPRRVFLPGIMHSAGGKAKALTK